MRFFGLVALSAGALLIAVSSAARADVFTIDNFSVGGTGAPPLFNDTFSQGVTLNPGTAASGLNLPSGTPANYFVTGTGPITEANGRAVLDTANGLQIPATGTPFPFINTLSAQLQVNFSRAGNFTTTGIFDLALPSMAFNSYGIQLIDLTAANNGNIAALRVVKAANGDNVISFLKLDRINNTSTIAGSILLDATHDQVLLQLSQTINSDQISGAYEYLDNGVGGPLITFGATVDLSGDGATIRRSAFNANGVIPEPGTFILLVSGLAGLGWLMRGKERGAT